MAITPDSKFIASLSAHHPQVLAIWEWTTDSDKPVCTIQLEQTFGLQSNIRFNTESIYQLVTNSSTQTIFYEWDFDAGFKFYDPIINDQVR